MKSRIVRWGAMASLMVLVTLAGAMALYSISRESGRRDLEQRIAQIQSDAAILSRRLDLTAHALSRDMATVPEQTAEAALTTAVAQIQRELTDDGAGRALTLQILGAAQFTLRDGALTPVAIALGALGPDAREPFARTLQRLAEIAPLSLADHASDLEPGASSIEAHVMTEPAGVEPGLPVPQAWMLMRSPDGGQVTALFAAVAVAADAGVMPGRVARAGVAAAIAPHADRSIDSALKALAAAETDPGPGRLDDTVRAAALGDGAIVIALAAPPRTLFEIDLSALTGPFLILIVAALVAFAQSDRLRHEQMMRRQRAILKGVAAKQRELEASEERFRHLAESTNVVPWSADLDRQQFTYVGPQIEALSGYSAATWRAAGFWTQHIHPNDRQRALRRAVDEASGGRYATVDYRVRAADGRILHMRNMLTIGKETVGTGADRRIAHVAHGFLLDVTELKRAAAALEVARSKAEEANRVKSEFLASMSHELRTPLNAVIGFSEIMKEEMFGPLDPQYREYAESVHASGRHLLDLINDVLDLSKIEAGRIELAEEETDIVELLGECRTLLRERIASAGLHERFEVDPDLPHLLMDGRRIKQVALNLLSNAIKFTPPGGEIAVIARREPGRGVMVAVKDTGIGMAPDEIPKALSKFGQIDGELARKHEGTGLGLPIAKSLIEMHGGALEILSEKGKGTEMRLWLPESRMVTDAA